jgi:hypothetical protein
MTIATGEQVMQRAIICDLDGTLSLYDRSTGQHYDRDYENDEINPAVQYVLEHKDANTEIVFISGRKETFRKVTKEWLDRYGFGGHPLFMRKTTDNRKDVILKKELCKAHIRDKYEVIFVLDDRNQSVDLWRSLGLTCFQVAPGDF